MTMTPIITGYGSPAVRGDTLQVIGTGFGRVSSAALVNGDGDQFECEFIIDWGTSIHLTVPRLLPDDTYIVKLGTLDNIASQNMAAPLVIPDTTVPVPDAAPDPEPVPDPASVSALAIMRRARQEYGDYSESFQASVTGDGLARRFELPVEVISLTGLSVMRTLENGSPTALVANTDYTLNTEEGIITLPAALPNDAVLTVTGAHYQFFTDDELVTFVRSAALKHTHSAEDLLVYRDAHNFKRYLYSDQTVDTIAPVEHHVVAILAAIEALEVIRSDTTYDINVMTADGTSLPREDRFRNIGELIAAKQARYDDLCSKLGVGLGRIEVFTLRRISRTTGRLVPVFVDREYDDVRTPPLRVYAPRNKGVTGAGFDAPDPYSYGGTGVGGYP